MHINHWYHKKKQPIAVDVFFSWYLLLVMWAQQHVGTSSSSSSSSSFISSIVVSSISSYITSILHSIYIYIYLSVTDLYIYITNLYHLSSTNSSIIIYHLFAIHHKLNTLPCCHLNLWEDLGTISRLFFRHNHIDFRKRIVLDRKKNIPTGSLLPIPHSFLTFFDINLGYPTTKWLSFQWAYSYVFLHEGWWVLNFWEQGKLHQTQTTEIHLTSCNIIQPTKTWHGLILVGEILTENHHVVTTKYRVFL